MKPRVYSRLFVNTTAITAFIVATFASPLAFAASATWNGAADATWATEANWSATPVPGAGDIATFNNAGGAVDTIDLGVGGITLSSIIFDTATAAAYTIGSGAAGSQTLALQASGAITATSTIAANQLINANVSLGSAASNEAFTITNSKAVASNSLTLAGGLSTTFAGTKSITIAGSGVTAISGAITDGIGSLALAKTGSSVLTLSGANNYSGGTSITGILNAANSSALGVGGVTIDNAIGNQLQLGNGVNLANALTLNGGGIAAQGVMYVPTGNATYSGTINAATQSAGGHFATAGYVGNALTISGNNSITSAVPITVRNGTIIISGSQNYTGGTLMNGAAFVQFGKTTSMPATGSVVTIANGVIAANAGGAGEFTGGVGAGTIGGLLAGTGGQGAPITWIANTTLGIDTTNAAGNVVHSGAWTPSVAIGLIKLGTGTLELTGGGTYASTANITGFPFIARQGTLLLNGGTHNVTGEAVVGGTFGKAPGDPGLAARLQIDSGTLAVSGYLSIGRGNGIGGVSSDLVANNGSIITAANFSAGFNVDNLANLPKGSVTLNNTSAFTITGNGVFNLAERIGSNMTMTLNNSAQFNAIGTGAKYIGQAGTGTLNINNSAAVNFANQLTYVGFQTGTGFLNMAGGTFNPGELRVGGAGSNGAFPGGSGTANFSGGIATLGGLVLARGNDAAGAMNGNVNISNTAVVTSVGDVVLGGNGASCLGKLVISGGTLNVATTVKKWMILNRGGTASGQMDVDGGTVNLNVDSDLRFSTANAALGTNVVNLNSGAINSYNGNQTGDGAGVLDLQQATGATSNNTFNLNGGTLAIREVLTTQNSNIAAFNFNGGTLKATGNTVNFLNLGGATQTANVLANGAVINSNGYNVTIPQPLISSGGGGGLTKQGSGSLTLSATSTYTGPTLVTGGALNVGGNINTTSGVSINGSGAKFVQISSTALSAPVSLTQGAVDGTHTINTVTVANALGNTVAAGNGGIGTLTVGNLTFNGAATLVARANGTYSDQYIIATDLSTSASSDVVVNATNSAGVWTSGITYPVIEFTNYAMGDATHFTLGAVPGLNPNQSATLVNTGSSIGILITGESLVWNGSPGNPNWTIGGATNWKYLGNPIGFSNNSPVVFDDSASSFAVNLAENVTPSAIVFDNANDYTVSSTGGFGISTGTLVLNGTGKVTINTINSFTGSTSINAGILEILGSGSIATSSSIANNSELIFNLTGPSNVYANPISGTGAVSKLGAGALTLSGANTFSGAFTLDAGALNFNSANALGTGAGMITINGGTIDNTSGVALTSTSTKPQTWNTDISFLGSNSLSMGTGAVTLAGSGTSRTVSVPANTFGVGAINGTGFDLVKTGTGTLNMIGGNIGRLDIQGGVVGTSGYLFATGFLGSGILQSSGAAFSTNWTYWNLSTDQTYGGLIRNNDGTVPTAQLTIVKRGPGTLTLTNNANNVTGTVHVDSGRLVLNNTGTYGAQNGDGTVNTALAAVVGWDGGADGVLEINGATVDYKNRATVAADTFRSTLNIGANATGAGALRLISGSLTTDKQIALGAVAGAYGAMTQTGGTTTIGGFVTLGLGASRGVLNVSNGTFTHNGPLTNGANTGSSGIINLSGTAIYNCNNTSPFAFWIGEAGNGALNVSGSASLTLASTGSGITVGGLAGGRGIINLLGGTVTAKSLAKGAGTGELNFNGGTLAANAASATFLSGLTSAYVHAGGGIINNGGNAITIVQPLLAPTGDGVSASGLSISGGGYIDTPIVEITGDGTGATAVANIDSSGNLTGITMTNPGVGYTNATFAVVGGGVNNTGSIGGSATLVPNTSGSLTFTGGAITTLSGVNTYTGNTIVNSGSAVLLADNAGLKFVPTTNGVTNKVTGAGAAYIYGDFTIDLTSAAIANGNSWTLVDTTTKTFDALTFTVTGFSEPSPGVHQRVEGNNTWTFSESTGALTLTVTASAGYANWITGFGLAVGDQDPTDDPDNDGLANLAEYALNGNPSISDPSIAPTGVKSGSNYIFSYKRSDLSEGDTVQTVEYGDNLTVWGSYTIGASPGVAPVSIAEDVPTANLDTVTVTIPTAGATKFFARLKVVK